MRLTRRSDGTVVTGDCRARLQYARKRGALAFAVAMVMVFGGQLWTQAFGLRALWSLMERWQPTHESSEPARLSTTSEGPDPSPEPYPGEIILGGLISPEGFNDDQDRGGK